ncbi:Por secretion system C-terminal sorting domain-containing protein [Flexibacter flexilis DSM 6793]|uniref:Por secretion system C-terminal sorting domain-containing protein n=2 Tax=Flexibacter flexilis DSM 6793 TaxID=927664 RepID=A0A1I1NR67_9BACT|nr:right-handed parallel beta-helix repeat-containing protein [Flexibacter flexilis]SFD00109.1 Por secretion system C-terminal sorting domain-containing protein [Flexibacter flexilis DSM 6793]
MNATLHWAKRSLAGLLCLAAMSVANPMLAQQTQTPVQVTAAPTAPLPPVVTPTCDGTHYLVTAVADKYWWYDPSGSLISNNAKLLINNLPDGLYSLVTYSAASGTMSSPAYFQLLGNTSTYSGVLVYPYATFIHKDITFAHADVTFSGNQVYVYGQAYYGSPYGGTVDGPLVSLIKESILRLTNTHFRAACDQMWKGFELTEVKAVYADNSIIEDSYQGLKDYTFQNPNSAINVIGTFEVTECQFINNYRAMELAYVRGAIITHNHFTSNENIKAPFDIAHNGSAPDERFYAYSGVEMGKPFSCKKFMDNSFDNCLFGVYVHGSGFNGNTISECTFKDNKIAGIYTEDWLLKIDNCTFGLAYRKETYDMHTNAIPNMAFQVANNGVPAVYGIINAKNSTNLITGNTFEGLDDVTMKYSIGIAATSISTIKQNTFNTLWRGLHWVNGAGHTATVEGNQFNANLYGLYLDNSLGGTAQTLNLKCNTFEPNQTASYTQTGLYVSANTSLNNIGGDGTQSMGYVMPAGNVWPVKTGTVRSQLPQTSTGNTIYDVEASNSYWASPNNWVSIENNGSAFKYWRYKNEFVGTTVHPYTTSPVSMGIPLATTDPVQQTTGITLICTGFIPATPILFPVSRMGNPNVIAGISSGLGQSVRLYPNPARDKVMIESKAGSVIELMSVTGQLLHREVSQSEQTEMSLNSLRTGIYVLKVDGVSHPLSVIH